MMSLHETFEQHVASAPDHVAISFRGQQLSYGELNRRANRLAHALRAEGVDTGVLVGLHLRAGPDLIAGMLAIVKAGGAYLPLDPDLPATRRAQILSCARPALTITDQTRVNLPADGGPAFCLAERSESIRRQSDTNPCISVNRSDLCYIMFTSGSTGMPKGVMVSHGNLEYLFDDADGAGHYGLDFDASDVWTLFHTAAFGFSVWEIWGALSHGGTLAIVAPDLRADPARFFELLRDESVTIVSQTPSAFRQNFLHDDFSRRRIELSLRAIVLSGEAVVTEDLRQWYALNPENKPRLINTYAITETAGQIAVKEYSARDEHGSDYGSIGRPLRHARIFILDANGKPVSDGTTGELYVGGPGVALGYLGDDRQTSERFLELSVDNDVSQRVYRTGDRACRATDGELFFFGRADDQVKLRGYRVELAEVETALRAHPSIRDAAAAIREDNNGQARLVGYVVPGTAGRDIIAGQDETPEFWPAVGPYQLYDEFLYDLMSSEAERIERYRRAFESSVTDKIVLDIGTGEHALLARMCVEAGARRVYAVEVLEDAYEKARALIEKSGLDDRIIVMHGDMSSLDLPEQVDVCTQGIIGNIGSADGIVPIWNAARRFFSADCVAIPVRCQTMIAAVELPDELRCEPAFSDLASSYARKAFEKLGREFDIRLCVRNFPERGIISDTQLFEDLNFCGPLEETLKGSAVFTIGRNARLDGFLVWSVVTTAGAESVDYLRNQQAWLPVYFPVSDHGVAVDAGERIRAEWSGKAAMGICPDYRINVWQDARTSPSKRFSYASRYEETAYRSTSIHRALLTSLPEESVKTSVTDLKSWLDERLPDYMVPAAWVQLSELPLNAHGKLDRKALPAPSRERPELTAAYTAPGNALEADLSELWTEVLGLDRIGVGDNFFDLGGDSISAVRLTSAMQRLLDDAVMLVAIFDAPTIEELARYLRAHHEQAVNLRYDTAWEQPVVTDSRAEDGRHLAPLSYPQQSFWLLEQLYPGQTGANEQFLITLDGPVNVSALERAWNAVIQRHEILRTVFSAKDGEVTQVVRPHAPVSISTIDCREMPETRALDKLLATAGETIVRPYDLEQGPLIEARHFAISDRMHRLLVNAHHIIADGLSLQVIKDELASFYELAVKQDSLDIPPLPEQYEDFARGQRARTDKGRRAVCLDFWRQALQGSPDGVALPEKSLSERSGHQRRIGFEIDSSIADRLRTLSRRENATLFMTLLAAFRTLLHRYSGQDDIAIGSPVTARNSRVTREMIGCFVNNVVFRSSAAGDPSFCELLRRERESALAALQHSDIPFEKIVESLRPQRRAGRQPFFQTLFLFEANRNPATVREEVEFGLETLETDRCSYWDLEFSVTDDGPGRSIRGFLGYRTDVYESTFAEAIPGQFHRLLCSILAQPEAPVSTLELLSRKQRQQILELGRRTDAPYPADETLHALFAEQARRRPLSIAIASDAGRMTYAELERRANRLAQHLRDAGCEGGDLIGIRAGRSADTVAAMLAILKIGAAYLPLDPQYPQARIEHMARDAGIRVIVADRPFDLTSFAEPIDQIRLDRFDWESIDADAIETMISADSVRPDAPAYVLYTSGSTGQPKGAVGLHATAVNRCHWMWQAFAFSTDDIFSLRTSLNFIDSVWEIFGALIHGATVAVIPDDATRDPLRLMRELEQQQVNHIVLVPALLQALLEEEPYLGARLPALRTWLTSGEPLSSELLQRFRTAVPSGRLLNTYGTSEIWDATCFDATNWHIDGPAVPIGAPIANARTFVLDEHLQPVPIGVTGELYVGGAGLGPGYWRRPELTAQRFVADPFSMDDDARLYRTGDLARIRADGNLECLGRVDRQIKLRGIRIEPGEIEALLAAHPAIEKAVVDLRDSPSGEAALVAYCVAVESGLDSDALRRYLRRQVPEYMIPGYFLRIDTLPLTPNGKIDRLSLPEPDASQPGHKLFVPPGTDTEKSVASLWADILGVERVGLQDDFFEQGGHSLSATRLIARIRSETGVELSLRELFDEPTVFALAARIDFLLSEGAAERGDSLDGVDAIQRVARSGDELPLSFGQERLWFLDQLDPNSPAYNIAFTVDINGDLNIDAMQSAIDHLVARHEILRTCFPSRDGRPIQKILSALSVPMHREDHRATNEDELQARLRYLAGQPFDLVSAPLLRTHLIRRTTSEHMLLIVIHHIVSDGVSNAILFDELVELYGSVVSGVAPSLTALPFQYADYANWQRQRQAGLQADIDYWTRQLKHAPAALDMPTDRPRPPEQYFRGRWIWREVSADTADALRALGRKHNCTLFMVMHAAFDVLLHRYTGQSDIVVGTPIAGRSRAEFEGLIGLFINTVVLRADLSGNPLFSEILGRLRKTILDAQAHQALPFERLVETLQPDRTLSHAPVFQAMFNLTPIPQRRRGLPGVSISMGRLLDHGVSTFDLTLSIGEHADGLDMVFEYDRELFDRETIERFATHYMQLTSAILAESDRRILDLPMLTDHEVQLLGDTWCSESTQSVAAIDADRFQAIHEMFESHVDSTPNAIALCDGDRKLSYAELEGRANRLAHYLRELGVGAEDRVALCLEKSEGLLVAVLGVQKAGAAYVPLDVEYPARRIAELLSSTGAVAVIADSAGRAVLPNLDVPLIDQERMADTLRRLPETRVPVVVEADQLAYVLYTSGSAGRAKGVMVTHGNICSAFRAWHEIYELEPSDRHLQMAASCFDVFTGDWVRALCSGGTLVLCPRLVLLEPERLWALMRDARVTCAEFVPAVARLLTDYLKQTGKDLSFMRLILVGSDTWFGREYDALKRLCGADTRLINSYGTAEATIDSTYFEADSIRLRHDAPVPIGRPFPHARVYILDNRLQLAPIGVHGELCIGGPGVARGYLEQPELTSERFVEDPFDRRARLFRSGDRARYRSDGTIELLGRNDQQVKLRGFRIELGEIEGALGDHRDVVTSVVVLRGLAGEGNERLVAYVVPRADPIATESLRRYLKRRLPDYMIPSLFVQCAELPLNANGKIDRQNLPEPTDTVTNAPQQLPPRTPVEADLCSLFAEVLGVNRVDIYDSFFDLGGHSLLATQLVSRIRDALDVELPVRTLFESPTPAALTRSVSRIPPGSIVPLRKAACTGDVPASFAQQRLWFLAQLEPGSTAYHLHWTGRLFGALDRSALNRAISALLKRHATLRSTFSDCDGMPLQHIAENACVQVNFSREPAASASFVDQWVSDLIAEPFDLSTGPLLRMHLLQVDEHEHVLAIVMHHIISDGWSMSVLFRELATAYKAYRSNSAPDWPPLPVQYADYSVWQRETLADVELERQVTYWRAQLAGAPTALGLPTDNPRTAVQGNRGEWLNRQLPEDLCQCLHELGRDEGCTLFMVLLAAFDIVLGHYAGQQDVLVGTPIAGRNRTELEGLIGFFVNTLVLRTDLSGNPSFRDLLARVKQTALSAYANQDLPFEKLVEVLGPERDRRLNPIIQTLFTLHNQPARALSLEGLQVRAEQMDSAVSKFDLSLHVGQQRGRLHLAFAYNADLFDAETVSGIAGYYESVLRSVVVDAGQRIGALAGLSRVADARERSVVVLRSGTLVDAFTAQVCGSGKRLAVKTAEHEWSYGALDARANRVAHGVLAVLPAAGDEHSPRVGLMCAQDAPLLAGLLGILKAGAAYVPLDPAYPQARLEALVADAGISVVVADAAHAESAGRLGRVVEIEALGGLPDHAPGVSVAADALAYIIYTSGTTGEPKGVMQTHEGVLQQIARYSESLALCAEDRLSLLSGYGFDAAVQDIFGALLAGAAVYPVAMRESMRAGVSSSELVDQLVSARITVLHATPTVYRYLLGGELSCAHDLSCIRRVVLGGEAVRRADFEIFKARFARGTQFVNGLGLTESTLALQYFADHETRLLGQVVPVGEAVSGMEVELLDESGAPSWYGEIVLTGAGIAAGYWGQPALTQRCFQASESGTVYRTGDIGRRLPDGQIAYVGRRDEQVKVRGYRVELGEIESRLAAHPQVSACVAAVAEGPGDARLVAYVVASPGPAVVSDELRAYLAAHLPDYMLPQGYELVEQLPMLANGKVDRSRLPAPQWGRDAQQAYVPPRTELEDVLTGIWLDVLQLDEVGVHDDFFALGGHSLLATRLISRVRDHLDLEVPLLSLFESPTIASLAAAVVALKKRDYLPPIVTIPRADRQAGNSQPGRNHREKQ